MILLMPPEKKPGDVSRKRGEVPSAYAYDGDESIYRRTTDEIKRVTRQFAKASQRDGQAERFEAIEERALDLVATIMKACPACYEVNLALEKIQNAVLYSCSAIMMNETWNV